MTNQEITKKIKQIINRCKGKSEVYKIQAIIERGLDKMCADNIISDYGFAIGGDRSTVIVRVHEDDKDEDMIEVPCILPFGVDD